MSAAPPMTARPTRRGMGLSMAMWQRTGWVSSCARTVKARNPLMTSPYHPDGGHRAYDVKR